MKTPSENKIKGVLFGQAIGDALGLGAEHMNREEVRKHYPDGLRRYSQILRDWRRRIYEPGDWTDDTEMALCVAAAIVRDKDIRPASIARNFKDWFNSRPKGIGGTTYKSLAISEYAEQPLQCAEVVWKLSGRQSAGNGGIMRTSVVGLWHENVEEYAADICRLTHYDPRCAGSCALVSRLIHSLAYEGVLLSLDEMLKTGERYGDEINEYILKAYKADSLDELELDDAQSQGYTLKTMAAALWCLFHCGSFKEGLLAVVNAGGDADTNAAVAGSVLGARYGYDCIPVRYIMGLNQWRLLEQVASAIRDVLWEKA